MKTFRKAMTSALALLLCACSSGSGGTTTPTNEETPSDSITVALIANLMTMDSSVATDGTSFTLLSTCMSGLVQNDPDGVPYPDLATWDISDDGTVYTFHIDPNANWSNGEPVTAQDFVFAWKRLADPDTASDYAFFLDTIHVVNAAEIADGQMSPDELGVEAVDDKTFVVNLTIPCGFILTVLSNPVFFPINEKFFNEQGDKYGQSIDALLYNGAYTFTRWDEGTAYAFTKNPEYIHADEIENNELEYRIILETQTAMLEFEQGNIDVVTLTGEMVDLYKDNSAFHSRLDGTMWYLNIQLQNKYLANANVRQALSYAIDRKAIAENVLKDGSMAAEGLIGREFAYLPDGTDYRDAAGVICGYDEAQAKEYWAKAQEEIAEPITLELYYEDSDSAKAVAENLQMMLKTTLEGIEISMNCKPKKTRLQDLSNHKYEIMLTRWGPDYADPQTFLDMFVSDSDMNRGFFFNEEYDELVYSAGKGEAATDPQKRMENYIAAEKILIKDNAAIIPVYQTGNALMVTPGVEGIIYGIGNGTYRHIHRTNQ